MSASNKSARYDEELAISHIIKMNHFKKNDFKKSECPDWYSEKHGIGVEVTIAEDMHYGQYRSFFRDKELQALSPELRAQEINKKIKRLYQKTKQIQYSPFYQVGVTETETEDGKTVKANTWPLPPDDTPEFQELHTKNLYEALISKLTKLNKHYKKYNENDLYIFTTMDFAPSTQDINYFLTILNDVYKTNKFKKHFDYYYININGCVYRIKDETQSCTGKYNLSDIRLV